MKRLICGTVTALLLSMPLFAQTSPSGSTTQPSGSMDSMDSTKTTTEEVKRTTSPSGDVTEEVERMEDTSKSPSKTHSDGMQDSNMQQPSNSTTPSSN